MRVHDIGLQRREDRWRNLDPQPPAPTGAWRLDQQAGAIAAIADRVEILCYQRDAAAIRAAVARVRESIGPEGKLTVGLCAYAPATPDADSGSTRSARSG